MQHTIAIITTLLLVGIFTALYLWDRQRKKEIPLEEKHDRFDELLREKIKAYQKRKAPKLGKRYVRRAIDNLYETGYLHPKILKEEYNKIVQKKSNLSLEQREFIRHIIHATAIELDQQIKNEKR